MLLFIYDRKLSDGTLVPNGLAERGPMWQRFIKREEEYSAEYCRTPLLTLLTAESVPYRQCTLEDFKSLSLSERSRCEPIYLMEMLYSYRVWLPLASGESFPLHPFSQIPSTVVDAINRGEMKFVITHLKRPERDGTPWELFSRTLNRVRDAGIDPRRAHFLGCTEDVIEQFELERTKNPKLSDWGGVHYLPYFERGWHSYYRHYRAIGETYPLRELEADLSLELQARPHRASFLAFNRELRAHRRVLLGFLSNKDLISQSLVSCPNPDPHFPLNRFDEYGEGLEKVFLNPQLREWGDRDFLNFAKSAPYTVDHDDLYRLHISWCTKKPFRESALCLLTERLFHSPHGHVLFTSKIFKSICNSHPFLLLAAPGALKRLKAHGYQTFAPLLDESYDSIVDSDQRMLALLNQIDRLARWSKSQWWEFTQEALPRLRHNISNLEARQQKPLGDYLKF